MCKPRTEALGEGKSVNTLISDFYLHFHNLNQSLVFCNGSHSQLICLPSQRWCLTFIPAEFTDLLLKNRVWKVKNIKSIVKTLGKHYQNKVIGVNINRAKSYWQHLPTDRTWWERHFISWYSSQRPIIPTKSGENLRQIRSERYSTKYLTRTPQNCQVHEKQRLKSCPIPQGTRKHEN